MATMYIANSTKQHHEFVYRLPEQTKIYSITIPYGEQRELLHKDLSSDLIDYILNQHKGDTSEYMVEAKTIDRSKGFVGLIYSFDKPVDAELIANTIYENDGELDLLAKKYREDTTVATEKMLEDSGTPATNVSSEIVQEVKNGVNENDAIAQGTTVAKRAYNKK